MAYELYGKEPVALYHQIGVDEMLCRKTRFHYTGPPEELEGCQWPMPRIRYAAYRLTLTIHMILWLALSFYEFSSSDEMPFTTPTKWFLQLGNWNMLILLGYTVWSLAIQVNTLVRDFYKKWQINKNLLDYTDSKMLSMLKTEKSGKKSGGRRNRTKANKSRSRPMSSAVPLRKSASPKPRKGSPGHPKLTKPGILKRPTKVFPHDPSLLEPTEGMGNSLNVTEPQTSNDAEANRNDSKNTSCRIKKLVAKRIPRITLDSTQTGSSDPTGDEESLSSTPSLSGSFMPIDFDPMPQKEEPKPQWTVEPPTPIDVPIKHKVGWVLYDISFTLSIATTVIFWTMQYDGEVLNFSHLFYGLNIVVVLLDSFMIPYPIYFLHIWHTYILGLLFTIGTVLYMTVVPDSDPNDVWVYTGGGGPTATNVSLIFLILIPGCQILSVMTYYVRARVFAHILNETLNPKDSWDAMPKRCCCCRCRNKCDCYDCFLV